MSKWIPVEERLPEQDVYHHSENVMFHNPDWNILRGYTLSEIVTLMTATGVSLRKDEAGHCRPLSELSEMKGENNG